MSFWYIATVYSKHEDGLDAAHKMACEQAALLLRKGVPVFSPIAHGHPIAQYGNIPPTLHELWVAIDKPMIEAACGVIMVASKGWMQSRGMMHELQYFTDAGKPVVWMTEGVFPSGLNRYLPSKSMAEECNIIVLQPEYDK